MVICYSSYRNLIPSPTSSMSHIVVHWPPSFQGPLISTNTAILSISRNPVQKKKKFGVPPQKKCSFSLSLQFSPQYKEKIPGALWYTTPQIVLVRRHFYTLHHLIPMESPPLVCSQLPPPLRRAVPAGSQSVSGWCRWDQLVLGRRITHFLLNWFSMVIKKIHWDDFK